MVSAFRLGFDHFDSLTGVEHFGWFLTFCLELSIFALWLDSSILVGFWISAGFENVCPLTGVEDGGWFLLFGCV